MKKITIVLFSAFMFFGCEDVIEIEVPSGESKLIVDAFFEVYYNQTPVTANTVVKLRESTDYFEEQIPIVTNAKKIINSKGFLTGVLNLTIDNAPTIPRDKAIFPEITLVIINVMGGSIA